MPNEFRPLFRTGKVNARVRKKGNGYEVRCQVDGERISVYGKLLYEAKAKFIVKLAELSSPSRPRKRNSILPDKKLYISGKTRHPRTVKRNFSTFREENSRPLRGHKENSRINICDCFLYPFGWGGEIFLLIFAKQILKFKPMLCKYLRSSLKLVRRTVFPPGGVALSSNLSLTASQVKQKEQAKACSFCLAGVERFELPDDGVRVRSLTAWRHPNI